MPTLKKVDRMIGGYILAALGGLALSIPVNLLADILPRQSGSLAEDLADVPTSETVSPERPMLRYGFVAALLAVVAAFLWGREGLTLSFGALVVYAALFVLIGIIDVEHRLILTIVILPSFFFALLEIVVSGRIGIINALAGYAIAQIVVLVFYLFGEVYLWMINRRRDPEDRIDEVAFGFGDVSLATVCGFIVGFPRVVPMLMLMVLTGAALAILYVIVRTLLGSKYTAHTALPYGPAILIAATLMLVWGPEMARLFGAQ